MADPSARETILKIRQDGQRQWNSALDLKGALPVVREFTTADDHIRFDRETLIVPGGMEHGEVCGDGVSAQKEAGWQGGGGRG